MDVRKPASMQLARAQCGGMRQLRAYTSEYQTKPAPRVAVSALGRAHIRPQSSVAPHPAPRAPAGPRHGHAGRGLHREVRDEDQGLPRQLQDRDEVDQGLLGDSLLNLI